jgi:hypothetical protein
MVSFVARIPNYRSRSTVHGSPIQIVNIVTKWIRNSIGKNCHSIAFTYEDAQGKPISKTLSSYCLPPVLVYTDSENFHRYVVKEPVLNKVRNILSPISVLLLILVITMAFLLVGCGNEEAGSEAVAVLPTAVVEPTALPATPTKEETAVPPTAEAELPPPDECLICHIDKEMLIQTADPIVEVISENEGEG